MLRWRKGDAGGGGDGGELRRHIVDETSQLGDASSESVEGVHYLPQRLVMMAHEDSLRGECQFQLFSLCWVHTG